MMSEPRDPQHPLYQWGQRVVALADMRNDGTFPERALDELLVEAGSEGEIVQVGVHEASSQPVYMVDFDGLVIGCVEEEIMLGMELSQLASEARGQARLPLDAAIPPAASSR